MKPLVTILTILIIAPTACAHPYHSSMTEVEWNAESGRFEVAMQLDAAGLEGAISIARGRIFRLESDNDADRAVRDYVSAHFALQHPDARSSVIRRVGHELELHTAWVSFEVLLQTADSEAGTLSPVRPDGVDPDGVSIENRCLPDVRPDTVCLTTVRNGRRQTVKHAERLSDRRRLSRVANRRTGVTLPDP